MEVDEVPEDARSERSDAASDADSSLASDSSSEGADGGGGGDLKTYNRLVDVCWFAMDPVPALLDHARWLFVIIHANDT